MFKITKNQIEDINTVCKAAATRHANQAFENVLINVSIDGIVFFTGGDGTIQIDRNIVSDKVETGFTISVNAHKFSQAITACGDCTVILKDQLIVKSGRRNFKLQAVDAESYPSFPEPTNNDKIDISAENLIDSIKSVAFASAKNDVRYVLNGVCIGVDAVATNGHRMAVMPLGLSKSVIVSIDAVGKIPAGAKGEIYISDNILSIVDSVNQSSFKCKLVDGRYPEYKKVVPKKSTVKHEATVNRVDFIDAIKAAQINMPDSGNVLFTFGENTIKSRSGKNEYAEVGFDCDCSSNFEMSFNSSYLLGALSSLISDKVTMGFTDSQVVIECDGMTNIISMCRI
jgi:DNA polymerase-3 subunit beta